jgi:hypothetical protein
MERTVATKRVEVEVPEGLPMMVEVMAAVSILLDLPQYAALGGDQKRWVLQSLAEYPSRKG